MTIAGTADLQPLVVRRAGSVDGRGDPAAERSRPWPEDRVVLGPGDAVAVVHRPSGTEADPEARDVDPVAECLLDHVGARVGALVDAVRALSLSGPGDPSEEAPATRPRVVAALAAPVGVAGVAWLVEATGGRPARRRRLTRTAALT